MHDTGRGFRMLGKIVGTMEKSRFRNPHMMHLKSSFHSTPWREDSVLVHKLMGAYSKHGTKGFKL